MNADFALPATGATARRLLHIAELCHLDLDDDVRALAAEDVLPGPATGIARAAIQFMLDCGLRCAVPHTVPALDRHLLLDAVAVAGAAPLTVVASGAAACNGWREALRAFKGFSSTRIMGLKHAFQPEQQEGRRDGVLILDWSVSAEHDDMLAAMAREFPRTLIHGGLRQQARFTLDRMAGTFDTTIGFPWWDMGACLFPQMPRRIFHGSQTGFEREVADSAVWKRRTADLAIFYNVFLPHFATMPGYHSG